MRNFKKLKIWQLGLQIATKTFSLTDGFPKDQKFGITSQMTRSAVSIASNIAEGCSKTSEKDYVRYIEISLGSSYELETQILISESVNFGIKEERDELYALLMDEQKMLLGFRDRLRLDIASS